VVDGLFGNFTPDFGADNVLSFPGTMENIFSIVILDGEGNDVTDNFEITTSFGTLTMTRQQVSFTSTSKEKVYDGEPLISNGQTDMVVDGMSGDFNIVYSGDNVLETYGTMENRFDITIYDTYGNDVTEYFDIDTNFGTLSITKQKISITTHDREKVYDGEPLIYAGSEALVEGLLENFWIDFGVDNSITIPGTKDNTFVIVVRDTAGADVTDNFDITTSFGTLTVTKQAITITTPDKDQVYDGTPLVSVGKDDSQVEGLMGDFSIDYGSDNVLLTPGTLENEFVIRICA
jgi:hypothetical protein